VMSSRTIAQSIEKAGETGVTVAECGRKGGEPMQKRSGSRNMG
jgi:hypothetical protein